MEASTTDKNQHGIANFMALETAIANSEEDKVKQLLGKQAMQELEKSYLIDLAHLSNNVTIKKLLSDIPVKENSL